MPRTNYRETVQDGEIVAAIVAGDPAGLAAAYDNYAPGLYAYCRTLLSEPADAADAVQDTYVIAAAKLDGLREPDRLRPWLYAVARNECYRRLRARGLSAPLDAAVEVTSDEPDVELGPEREELRGLVVDALSGLNPSDREIIELNLRHVLDGEDLADALGVSRNHAHALASRARAITDLPLYAGFGISTREHARAAACPFLDLQGPVGLPRLGHVHPPQFAANPSCAHVSNLTSTFQRVSADVIVPDAVSEQGQLFSCEILPS